MDDSKPINPLELDQAEAAKKIQEAGVADESAAATTAAERTGEAAAEAHPS